MDGSVLLHTSADEPVTALARLKHKHGGGNPSVSVGHYRLSEDMVLKLICFTFALSQRDNS